MPFSVGNRVSCSAINVLGKKPAKQRFRRLSATKELDGVAKEAQGIGRKVKYSVHFSELGISMALSARSLTCQVIDASSSDSTSVYPPPPFQKKQHLQQWVLQNSMSKKEMFPTMLYFAMEYNGRLLIEFLKTGDACLDLEHTPCGVTMWMRCVGHHSAILCCHFHPIH